MKKKDALKRFTNEQNWDHFVYIVLPLEWPMGQQEQFLYQRTPLSSGSHDLLTFLQKWEWQNSSHLLILSLKVQIGIFILTHYPSENEKGVFYSKGDIFTKGNAPWQALHLREEETEPEAASFALVGVHMVCLEWEKQNNLLWVCKQHRWSCLPQNPRCQAQWVFQNQCFETYRLHLPPPCPLNFNTGEWCNAAVPGAEILLRGCRMGGASW